MSLRAPVLFCATLALGACAPGAPWEADAGARRAPQEREKNVYPGVVESVREVEIDSARTGVAPAAGAVLGGVVGGEIGRGRGAAAGAVVGTVAGAVAGEAAARAGKEPGIEITVRLDHGPVVAITQPPDETFKPGERVRVLSDGVRARVMR